MLAQVKEGTKLKQGWSDKYSNDEYHHGALKYLVSSSDLKNFHRSPAHYRAAKEQPDEPTPAMNFGSAFHSLVMGFESEVIIAPEINRRTKDGKAEYKAFLKSSTGKYVVSAEDMIRLKDMCAAVNRHRYAKALLKTKHRELTGIFRDYGTDMWCKIRPDLIDFDQLIISDLKTTVDASVDAFTKTIFNYHYNWSAAWYKHGAEIITGKRFAFVIIAVEKVPPYGVNTFNITGRAIRMAVDKIFEMTGDFADCFLKDKWPCYDQWLIEPDVPAWVR